jgi:hypothetical protein
MENFINCPFRLLIWTVWGGVSFVKWTRLPPSNSVLAYYHYYESLILAFLFGFHFVFAHEKIRATLDEGPRSTFQ